MACAKFKQRLRHTRHERNDTLRRDGRLEDAPANILNPHRLNYKVSCACAQAGFFQSPLTNASAYRVIARSAFCGCEERSKAISESRLERLLRFARNDTHGNDFGKAVARKTISCLFARKMVYCLPWMLLRRTGRIRPASSIDLNQMGRK